MNRVLLARDHTSMCTMGPQRTKFQNARSSTTGQFTSALPKTTSPALVSDNDSNSGMPVDNNIDSNSDFADDLSSDHECKTIALPTRKLRRMRKARTQPEEAEFRVAEMKRVEKTEAGPSAPPTRQSRGRYAIGGLAPRTICEQKQKAKQKALKDGRDLESPEFQ